MLPIISSINTTLFTFLLKKKERWKLGELDSVGILICFNGFVRLNFSEFITTAFKLYV